jgi:hypothetical protein
MELVKPREDRRSSKFSVRYELVDAAGVFQNHTKRKNSLASGGSTQIKEIAFGQPTSTCAVFRRVRKIAKKRLLASSCLSVRNNSAPTGLDLHEL